MKVQQVFGDVAHTVKHKVAPFVIAMGAIVAGTNAACGSPVGSTFYEGNDQEDPTYSDQFGTSGGADGGCDDGIARDPDDKRPLPPAKPCDAGATSSSSSSTGGQSSGGSAHHDGGASCSSSGCYDAGTTSSSGMASSGGASSSGMASSSGGASSSSGMASSSGSTSSSSGMTSSSSGSSTSSSSSSSSSSGSSTSSSSSSSSGEVPHDAGTTSSSSSSSSSGGSSSGETPHDAGTCGCTIDSGPPTTPTVVNADNVKAVTDPAALTGLGFKTFMSNVNIAQGGTGSDSEVAAMLQPVASNLNLTAQDLLNPANAHGMHPIAAENLYVAAPSDGADCGQARIDWASTDGNDFLSFTATLENPNPGQGLQGCAPVVNFWNGLANRGAPDVAVALNNFVYAGVTPVIDAFMFGSDSLTGNFMLAANGNWTTGSWTTTANLNAPFAGALTGTTATLSDMQVRADGQMTQPLLDVLQASKDKMARFPNP